MFFAGLSHEVCVSSFEENLDKASFPTPADYAQTNATSKAAAVVADFASAARGGDGRPVDLVIGSDTVVVVDGHILEKPRSEAAAFDMLSTLRYVDGVRGPMHLHSVLMRSDTQAY